MSATADLVTVSHPSGTAERRRAGAVEHAPEQVSVCLVGTYPPTRCGIATYTMSLAHALARLPSRHGVGVVSSVDEEGRTSHPPEVVAELVRGSARSLDDTARALDAFDVVVVQHEFGIYGGADGSDVLELVRRVRAPAIVVLHTVLAEPSPTQRAIVDELCRSTEAVVVQSEAARTRLLRTYDPAPEKIHLIPHGATVDLLPRLPRRTERRPTILTWGLIGPTKGIEFAIDAMASLRDLDPLPRYVVLGQTHPRVMEREGEGYRESLAARARAEGVDDMVELHSGYLESPSILAAARAADAIVLPYLDREQVVSGVLVEAVAAGTPVVATRFPHAVELLGGGSGILVRHESSAEIADALRRIFTDPLLATRMAAVAAEQGRSHAWPTVARAYARLVRRVVSPRTEAHR